MVGAARRIAIDLDGIPFRRSADVDSIKRQAVKGDILGRDTDLDDSPILRGLHRDGARRFGFNHGAGALGGAGGDATALNVFDVGSGPYAEGIPSREIADSFVDCPTGA